MTEFRPLIKYGNNKNSVVLIDGGYSRIELTYNFSRIGLL